MDGLPSPSSDITTRTLVITMAVLYLVFICYCFLYYFIFRPCLSRENQRQGDIEEGLTPRNRPQQDNASRDQRGSERQLIIIALENEERAFRKILWTNSKGQGDDEDITHGSTECVICLEEFENGDECWLRSECNHLYHESCIVGWLALHKRHCPLCRGYIPVTIVKL